MRPSFLSDHIPSESGYVPSFSNPAVYDLNTRKYVFHFPNGYGASVICGPVSYGGENGLWELAVLNSKNQIDYSTPITPDVLGWLTEDKVSEILYQISDLPSEMI